VCVYSEKKKSEGSLEMVENEDEDYFKKQIIYENFKVLKPILFNRGS